MDTVNVITFAGENSRKCKQGLSRGCTFNDTPYNTLFKPYGFFFALGIFCEEGNIANSAK